MENPKIPRDLKTMANKVLLIEGLIILITIVPSNYMSYILTDIIGISVDKVSSVISIGAVIATISVFVLGAMANFTNTKWGQFRPWLVGLAITAILGAFFITINFGHSGLGLVLVLLGVALFNIGNTLIGMARTGCFIKMSKGNSAVRNLLGARDWAGICMGSIIGAFVILPLVGALSFNGKPITGWILIQAIFTVLGVIGLLWILRLSKDTDIQRGTGAGLTKEEMKAQGLAFSWAGLWDMIKALIVNRCSITVFISGIFGWMLVYWPLYMQAYIAGYVFDDIDMLTIYLPICYVASFIITFFVEKIARLCGGRKRTVIFVTFVALVAFLIIGLVPAISMTKVGWCVLMVIIESATAVRCSLFVMMYFDAGEYWLHEHGKDHRAFLNASDNAAITICASLCGVLLGIILTKVGYSEGTALAVDSAKQLMSMYGLAGAGMGVLAIVPLFIHNKSDAEMEAYAIANLEKGYKSADEI